MSPFPSSGSGFIPPERIEAAAKIVEALESPAFAGQSGGFDEDGLASVKAAISYCRRHGLGLTEASDVVVPISDDCYSDIANLRAPFLNKMEP